MSTSAAQIGLFDSPPLTGHELKRRGMRKVLSKTPAWYRDALKCAVLRFKEGETFTVEHLTADAGRPPKGTHFNAVGALMFSLAKEGLMCKTGRMVRAKRPGMHGTDLAEWIRL